MIVNILVQGKPRTKVLVLETDKYQTQIGTMQTMDNQFGRTHRPFSNNLTYGARNLKQERIDNKVNT